MIAVEVVVCVLLADFLTGLVHWWEDTYGRPTWPWLGPFLIVPNLEHHARPKTLERTFLGRNGHALLLALVFQLPWALLGAWTWHVALVAGLAALGNEVHAWTHGIGRGRVAELLQEMALVQTPQHHARHHRAPFERHFCTLTNLVNPVLERVGFWRRAELAVQAWLGVPPLRGTTARDGR